MKMKQLVSLTLALLILGTRVGYAINVHYCGDRIAEVSLAFISVNCGMESQQDSKDFFRTEISKKSCCNDATVLFQNHEPQKVHLEVYSPVILFNKKTLFPVFTSGLKLLSISNFFLNWNIPPPKSYKLFLFQQSFIFYG